MSAVERRGASCVIGVLVALAMLASGGDALARSRKPHAVDQTGFGAVPRIELPRLSDPAVPHVTVAPARFFTINRVLAKLDGLKSGGTQLAALDQNTLSDAPGALPATVTSEPFGLFTFQAPEGALWQKWRGVSVDIAKDRAALGQCRAAAETCAPAARRFIAVIDAARGLDGRARLDAVNHAVNAAVVYMSDMAQHGVADLWSSPLATFASLRGDCEDYAIAKYVALLEAGLADADARIVLAHDNVLGEDHAVLAVRQDGRWLILDNRRAELLADADEKHLAPLFAIDRQGVKLFAVPYVQRMMDGKDGAIAPAADAVPANLAGAAMLPLMT